MWKSHKNISSQSKNKHIAGDTQGEKLFKEYKLASGKKCLVGISAKGNDAIRKCSHKDHLWFHLEGRESAHLIIDTESMSTISENELRVLASIIKENSQLLTDEIDLMYSPLKDLRPVKGKAGMVRVSRPKYLRINFLENWKEFLATCLLYTSPSPRDRTRSRMPSSA